MARPPKTIANKRIVAENATFPLLVMARVEMPTTIDMLENIRQRHPHLSELIDTIISDIENWQTEIEDKTIPALNQDNQR